MPVAHTYKLGKDQYFQFGSMIANNDVKNVSLTLETSAEAEVTTRGSEGIQEFVPVRWNSSFEVVCLAHTCPIHGTGVVSIGVSGQAGLATGLYYVNNVSQPQEIDGAIEYTISLKRHAGAQIA
jgi:hypothetical protein